jgi:hypothetical protein
LSVDYLVRLEQGRATNPSPQVVASLARALQVSDEERDHLYRLARQAPPVPTQVSTRLTPGVQRLLQRLEDAGVGVFDIAWTLVSWNSTWAALMGDPSTVTGRDRNLLWRHFTGAHGRVVRSAEEIAAFEEAAVADLRAAAGRYPHDGGLRRLVEQLQRASARFADLWAEQRAAAHHSDRKTIDHPAVGKLTLDCDVLTVEGSELRIVVYTAEPGTDDAEKLDLVRVIGLQTLSPTTS